MTATVAALVRHPVKSIGFEELAEVVLAAGATMPHDRRWAITHAAARPNDSADGWASKLNFLRGWAEPRLMAIAATLDENSGSLRLTHPDLEPVSVRPDTAEGAAALIAWVAQLWPAVRPEPARVVTPTGRGMTDQQTPYISILNRASNADLSRRMGQDLSMHRWRGNVWLDGPEPWAERSWIGQEITLGKARLKVEAHISRCKATEANPMTGRADADTLGALDAAFGHQDFGVFARVVSGGRVATGDRAEII